MQPLKDMPAFSEPIEASQAVGEKRRLKSGEFNYKSFQLPLHPRNNRRQAAYSISLVCPFAPQVVQPGSSASKLCSLRLPTALVSESDSAKVRSEFLRAKSVSAVCPA